MKVDFVMNNGSIITGNIKVHSCRGTNSLKQFIENSDEYIFVSNAYVEFVNDRSNSFIKEMVITKKDISFAYEIV